MNFFEMLDVKMNINRGGFVVAVLIAWIIGPGFFPANWSVVLTLALIIVGLALVWWREHDQ